MLNFNPLKLMDTIDDDKTLNLKTKDGVTDDGLTQEELLHQIEYLHMTMANKNGMNKKDINAQTILEKESNNDISFLGANY